MITFLEFLMESPEDLEKFLGNPEDAEAPEKTDAETIPLGQDLPDETDAETDDNSFIVPSTDTQKYFAYFLGTKLLTILNGAFEDDGLKKVMKDMNKKYFEIESKSENSTEIEKIRSEVTKYVNRFKQDTERMTKFLFPENKK